MYKIGICGTSVFFKNGMKQLIQNQDVTEFDSLSEARKAANIYRSMVVLIHESDLFSEAAEDLTLDNDRLKVIVVASKFDQVKLVSLINKGVRGYQLETVSSSVMRAAIQMVALGEFALPSVLAEHLGGVPTDSKLVPLSAKELVVIRCLAKGYANKEISRSIGIAEATTKVHVKAIMRKLGVSNRTQAAVWAVRNGFDQPLLQS